MFVYYADRIIEEFQCMDIIGKYLGFWTFSYENFN